MNTRLRAKIVFFVVVASQPVYWIWVKIPTCKFIICKLFLEILDFFTFVKIVNEQAQKGPSVKL